MAKFKFQIAKGHGVHSTPEKVYHEGETVETDQDLHALFDQPGQPAKFVEVDKAESKPVPPPPSRAGLKSQKPAAAPKK